MLVIDRPTKEVDVRKTYREILLGYTTSSELYAFSYGSLDALVELFEDGVIDGMYLRREAFKLRCAVLAREQERAREGKQAKINASVVTRSRVHEGDPVPRKSVEQVFENNDGVAQPNSAVTKP